MGAIERRAQSAILFGLIAAGCALTLTGLCVPYSYWYDEIWSVTAAMHSVQVMMNQYILADVHPPLYLLILHFWEQLAGTGEIAVRALSELFAIAAIGLFAWLGLKRFSVPAALFGLAIFATTWVFSYYAEEARSYALMLLLSTVLTFAFAVYANKKRGLAIALTSAFALSLVHYFGLVYAGLVLIALLWHAWPRCRDIVAICAVGTICLVWPAVHYTLGALGSYSGGAFWIQSSGFQTTLTKMTLAFFPALPKAADAALPTNTAQYLTALVALFALIALIVRLRKHIDSRALGLICIGLIGVVAVIDYISPVSTHRNYIVLLPSVAFMLADLVDTVDRRALRVALIACCAINVAGAAVKLHRKSYPLENWKALNRMTPGPTDFLLINSVNCRIQQRIVDFYLDHKARPITPNQLEHLTAPVYVIAAHKDNNVARLVATSNFVRDDPRQLSPRLTVLKSAPVRASSDAKPARVAVRETHGHESSRKQTDRKIHQCPAKP